MSVAKILIVEDEGLTAMGLQRKLKFWGYEAPTFAFSKKEAVKKAKELKPDLILMDIVLKGEGDGIDAVREIKNILDIPIIYLTAYSDEKTRKRADITEPFDYILKPYKENELHDSIERALLKQKFEKKLVETGKWADNKLKESGKAVIVTNKEGFVRFLNSSAQELTGFRREEALYMNLSEVFKIRIGNSTIDVQESGNDSQDFIKGHQNKSSGLNLVKNIINEGIVAGITEEIYLSNREGNEIPIECYASPLKDDNGDFLGTTLIFNDISQRFNAEKSLLESEEKFKSIYTQTPIGTGIYNAEGHIIDANSAALQLFGVDEISNLIEFNIFNDFKLNKKEKKMLLDGKTVKSNFEFNFEAYKSYISFNTTKSGNIYLEIIFKPLIFNDNDTSVSSYLVQFQDITEERDVKESLIFSKEMYNGLLESIEYPFIALDSDLNCKYSNKESQSLTGILTDETFGKSVWELLPDFKNPEALEEAFKKCMETQKSDIIIYDYGNLEKCFIELNINPIDEGLTILLKDVTADKSWEDEIKKREKLYHKIVDDINEPLCRFDPNGTLTYANRSYKKCFADGVNEKSFVFSIPSEYQEKMKTHITSFYEGNPVKILESPIKMPNGEMQWWRWVTKALFDPEGNIEELQSVGHDITEQRNLQVELNNSLNLLEIEMKEKTEYFESTKNSIEAKLSHSQNNEETLKNLSKELEEKVKETTQQLSEVQKDLKSTIEDHKIREKSFNQTIENLSNEFDDSRSKFDETLSKLQQELNAHIEIEEIINLKCQVLEINLEDTNHELSRTKIDMESQIYNHIKTEKSLLKLKNELQKKLEAKKSSLEMINKDLNTEIAKSKQIETEFHEVEEKLQSQLKKQIKYDEDLENMELEISELKTKYNEKSRLLKENEKLIKDVQQHAKRNMQRISTLTSLHSDHIRDQMVESYRDSQNHINSIALVHEKLYESTDMEKINFSDYVNSLVDDIYSSHGADPKRITRNIKVENISLDIDTATLCGLIINELVSNSIKHAFPGVNNGMIMIEINQDDIGTEMIISDDGVGLPERIDFEKTDSFGLQLVKTLTAEINGNIDLKKNHNGTKFQIKIDK
jgi:PAS domain S-box-containing protein